MWWLLIFIFLIIWFVYSKSSFWNHQPVAGYMTFKRGRITEDIHYKGMMKYANPDIKTCHTSVLTNDEKTYIQTMLTYDYLDVSYQRFDDFNIETWITENQAFITLSHAGMLLSYEGNMNDINMNYVDWMTIDRKHRGRKHAHGLIASHVRDIWQMNGNAIPIMFKREGTLMKFSPFVQYKAFCYNVEQWRPNEVRKVRQITDYREFMDIWDSLPIKYKYAANMITRFKQYKIYWLNNGIHVFRDYGISYNIDGWGKVLYYIGASSAISLQDLKLLITTCGEYKYIVIEGISFNTEVLGMRPLFETDMAYYIYNYNLTNIPAKDVIVI
jgi:hypothetical protein